MTAKKQKEMAENLVQLLARKKTFYTKNNILGIDFWYIKESLGVIYYKSIKNQILIDLIWVS